MAQKREHIATLTSRGQVTIPLAVREESGLKAKDKIVFRLDSDGKVQIERLPMSLEEAYGSVAPLSSPQGLEGIRQIAREEREELWSKRLHSEP